MRAWRENAVSLSPSLSPLLRRRRAGEKKGRVGLRVICGGKKRAIGWPACRTVASVASAAGHPGRTQPSRIPAGRQRPGRYSSSSLPPAHALLDGHDDGALLEDGPLAVAARLVLEPVADVGHVDEAAAEQVMADDEVPGGAGRQQPLARVGRGDAVAGRFVLVVGQQVRVEVGRGCTSGGPSSCPTRAASAAGSGRHGRRPEDLVLGADLLQVALEPLVFRGRVGLGGLERGQLGLEVLDVALLALAEGALSAAAMSALSARCHSCPPCTRPARDRLARQ